MNDVLVRHYARSQAIAEKALAVGAGVFGALVLGSSTSAHAETGAMAMQNLSTEVYTQVASEKYKGEGGDSLAGSELLVQNEAGVYVIDEGKFQSLSNAGKNNFISDIAEEARKIPQSDTGSAMDIDTSTVTNWLHELENTQGVGTYLMNEVLRQTKPDFATANALYEPFAPFISAAMGFFTILVFGALGLVIALDVAYITIPIFRIFSANNEKIGSKIGSYIISPEAIKAVEEAEGDGRAPLMGYLKKRIASMFLLGVVLVYLIQGRIYDLISSFLDLLSGLPFL